jgi:predicted CXXCH cytochrome family protein
MSCLSCHSLHQSDPDDQLAAGMRGNQACYQCHAEYEAKLTEHTNHAADSEGSRCYNCHMPHTSYGLMKGIRAHTVTNPSVEESTRHGRPNACNLCHLDQTLEWTGEHLTSWYGQPRPELDEEQQDISAALLWLLRGDAGQRALTAWHFGWEPARQASGTEWMAPFLAELLVDPYAAVRYIAHHSLIKSDGFEELSYDYIGPLKERATARRETLERWNTQSPPIDQEKTGPLLMNQEGVLLDEAVRQIINRRDDTPMTLWE